VELRKVLNLPQNGSQLHVLRIVMFGKGQTKCSTKKIIVLEAVTDFLVRGLLGKRSEMKFEDTASHGADHFPVAQNDASACLNQVSSDQVFRIS
jgi:hypothetical protein